jgi:hypothetical protein
MHLTSLIFDCNNIRLRLEITDYVEIMFVCPFLYDTVSAPQLLDRFYLIRFRGLSQNTDEYLQFSAVLAYKRGYVS